MMPWCLERRWVLGCTRRERAIGGSERFAGPCFCQKFQAVAAGSQSGLGLSRCLHPFQLGGGRQSEAVFCDTISVTTKHG